MSDKILLLWYCPGLHTCTTKHFWLHAVYFILDARRKTSLVIPKFLTCLNVLQKASDILSAGVISEIFPRAVRFGLLCFFAKHFDITLTGISDVVSPWGWVMLLVSSLILMVAVSSMKTLHFILQQKYEVLISHHALHIGFFTTTWCNKKHSETSIISEFNMLTFS